MSRRGRGTLEVKQSASPYFQTTSSIFGSDPFKQSLLETNSNENDALIRTATTKTTNFAFLYTRESDRIGNTSKPIPSSTISNTQEYSESQKRVEFEKLTLLEQEKERVREKESARNATESLINAYDHKPKSEHPRYTTSSNEVGRKCPTIATAVLERHETTQEFSRSFGNVKPVNSRMNTSITRSNVHSLLDSQFL